MKLTSTLVVGSLLASAAALSSFAVNDGSNASRAPLPSQRSADYVTITSSRSASPVLIADHIGRADSTRQVSVATPIQRKAPIAAVSPVTVDATMLVASAR